MRPEKFRYLMNKAFVYRVDIKEYEDGYEYKPCWTFVCDKTLLREMKRVWPKWAFRDDDYREGHETYGYQDIQHDLRYISDRWNCAFRLKWLIDGIEGDHFK